MLYGIEPRETEVLKRDLVPEQPTEARTGPLRRWSDLRARQPVIFFPAQNMKYCKSGLEEEKMMWLKLLTFSSSDTKAKRAPTGQVVAALFQIIKPYICRSLAHEIILTQEISYFQDGVHITIHSVYRFSACFLLISDYTFHSWCPRVSQHTLH